jgi:hypothetical protein
MTDHFDQVRKSDQVAAAGGRELDLKGNAATKGAFEVTRAVALYDSDGGVQRKLAEDQTWRYFKSKANAERSMKPGTNVTYSMRWVSDYIGAVEDD